MKIQDRTFNGDVPKSTKWLYSITAMFRDGCYQFVSLFLLTFVQFCGLGGVKNFAEYTQMYLAITIIVIVLRIWDGLNDPIMGFIIEKCHFKSGKYRPWIWTGAVLNSIVVILMFWVLPTGWSYVACFAVFYFLWDFTYTINDISYWSVLPSLSSNEKIRANITTLMSVFISIGSFIVGGAVPLFASGNQELTYQITAIIVSVLYALSQIILAVFMKEKKVDKEEEKAEDKMKFRDLFKVLIKNDQLRVSIIAVLLFYTGETILIAAGLNYFYFNFGYKDGGTFQLYFTIIYALGTLGGQFIYPILVNKFKKPKMKIFSFSCILTMISYLLLFFFVFFKIYNLQVMFFWLLCIFGFLVFFGQSIISIILYIFIQDTIDYNEFKFKERREASIFSLRAFTAKLASSIQQGILYIFLLASSLFAVSNKIANAEREFVGDTTKILDIADGAIATIQDWQYIVFQVGFALVPLVLFIIIFFLIRFKYKIDEQSHVKMVEEIEKRKNNNEIKPVIDTNKNTETINN